MKWKLIQIISLLSIILIFSTPQVSGHPADQYFQAHTLHLMPDGLKLTWSINPGPLLAGWVWNEADDNVDRAVSEAEARSWVEPRLAELTVSLDDAPLVWQIEAITWPASATDFQRGDTPILIQLRANWANALTEASRFQVSNQFEIASSINWFYLHGEAGIIFETPTQQGGQLFVSIAPHKAAQANSASGIVESSWQTYWDTGKPALAADLPPLTRTIIPQLTQDTRPFALLTEIVRTSELSLNFILIAFIVSAILGALHALTPGHGKTVVAAYLVGTKGTTKHAITLGSIVTLTHTGSVFALGLLTLTISQYILPTALFPVLEIVSGLLIVSLGIYLVYQRWLAWRGRVDHPEGHAHTYGDHHHDHSHSHEGHSHHHHHLPHQDRLTWRSLITLGISGGLVPCPDAIAILLVAIAINRIALGLSLIVAFSLGLAFVLIIIGLTMVHSRRLFEKMDAFGRLAPAMPVVSAVVVLSLGFGLTINAIRGSGAFAVSHEAGELAEIAIGQTTSDKDAPEQPSFALNQAGILYVDRDAEDRNQLFLTSLLEHNPQPLTQEVVGITDYALSPNGQTVAYTALRDSSGTDLWAITLSDGKRRQLVACENATCAQGVWAPNSQRLVYQRLNLSDDITARNANTLWWLDVNTGETGPVFQDDQLPSATPRWSPDGVWLGYNSGGNLGLHLYNLQDARSHTIPNRAGAPISWRPDSQAVLVSDVIEQEGQIFTHLFHFDLATATLTNLSGGGAVVDSSAVWSPDGLWIALVRRDLGTSSRSTGNQIWLMRPDGSQAHPLTADPDVAYGTPVWSPDSAYLLVHRYPLKVAAVQPALFLLTTSTGDLQKIQDTGYRPSWVRIYEDVVQTPLTMSADNDDSSLDQR